MDVPALGPRGEGWVLGQAALLVIVGWAGLGRVLGSAGWAPPMVAGAGALVWVAGVLVLLRGIVDLGRNLTPFPRPRAETTLVDGGVYRFVRHPIYSGGIAAALGFSLATGSMIGIGCSVLLALLFDAKSRREEVWLAAQLPSYSDYRRRTRKFLPGIY